MKKILIFLLLLSGIAKAQLPGSTLINSRYEWLGGKFRQLKLPAYADTASYPTWLPALAGDIMIDTSGADAGTVYARYGASAAWVKVTAGIAPSAIDNDNAGTGFNLLRPATQQIKRISLGVGLLGDSTTFANSNYFYVDTNLIYSYARSIAGTGTGGSGNPNRNVGSAFRLAIPNTNDIKTFAAGFGGLMDSATSNQLQYTVDSSTIQKKLAYGAPIFKNNNTLGLTGWSSILPNSVYGADASGVGVMRRAAIIDTALRHNGWSVVWDSVNSKHVYSYITGSGGGSTYVPPKLLQFIIGSTPNAPVAGTNTVTHDSLVGKFATLYRDGAEQYYNVSTNGYTFDGTGGTLTVNPPWVDGELVKIYRTNTAPDTLSAQPIPASWVDVTYPTQTGLTESPSKVWTGTNSSFGSQGLSGSTLTGTGWYIFKSGTPGSNANGLIGFKTTNSNGDYTTYNFGVYLSEESGHLRVNRVDGGAATAVSGAVYGVGYINYGDYAGVFRDVATGVVTLRTSADKITWTTSYTFGSTSTATLYMLMNPFSGTAIYQPQYKVGP